MRIAENIIKNRVYNNVPNVDTLINSIIAKKVCGKCRQEKPITAFAKDRAFKDGYKKNCKQCTKKSRTTYEHICNYCGEHFFSDNKNQKYCDIKCQHLALENKVTYNCELCGEPKTVKKSQYNKTEHHYCSKKCSVIARKQNKTVKCEICGKVIPTNQYKLDNHKHHYCSKKCKGIAMMGENNPWYNPNLTQEDREERRKIEGNTTFIKNVLKRDNYTCKCCGKRGGSNLIVHHLNGYNWDKENRLNIDNGVVLCEDCHKEFHGSYGYGNNTKEQFEEFINNKKLEQVS